MRYSKLLSQHVMAVHEGVSGLWCGAPQSKQRLTEVREHVRCRAQQEAPGCRGTLHGPLLMLLDEVGAAEHQEGGAFTFPAAYKFIG